MFFSLPAPPPQPPWEGLHPLVVHFPIALLLFAAVFVVLAAIVPKRGWWFSVSALILLIGGTVGASVSVSTGEAARDMVEDGEEEMFDVLQEHEDMALQARTVFVVLTAVYAFIVLLTLVAGSLQSWKFMLPANLIFLVALMGANLVLANAAHLGGRLVHQYSVLSALVPEGETAIDEEQEAEAEEDAEEEASTSEAAEEATAAPEVEMEAEAPAAESESPASAAEPEAAPAAEAATETPASAPASESAAPETSES